MADLPCRWPHPHVCTQVCRCEYTTSQTPLKELHPGGLGQVARGPQPATQSHSEKGLGTNVGSLGKRTPTSKPCSSEDSLGTLSKATPDVIHTFTAPTPRLLKPTALVRCGGAGGRVRPTRTLSGEAGQRIRSQRPQCRLWGPPPPPRGGGQRGVCHTPTPPLTPPAPGSPTGLG